MIQSVAKAFSVLFSIASSNESLSVSQLARDIDLPRTTVIRLLNTMQEIGVLAKNGRSDHYELGDKMLTLLNQAAGEEQLEVMVQNAMQQLSADTGETIYHCIPSGDETLYLSQIDARHAIQMEDWTGRTVPLYGTAVGKLQLAHYRSAQIDRYLAQPLPPFTPHTQTDPAQLRTELEKIRHEQLAWNIAEFEEDVFAIAAPIFNVNHDHHHKQLIGMLAIGGPQFRLQDNGERYAALLKTAATNITGRLTRSNHHPEVPISKQP